MKFDGLFRKIYEDNVNGKRMQEVDIYYSYVGIVDTPTDEGM